MRYDKVRHELERSPRKWLVTGCAGFIGSHLAKELLELGQFVVGLDNFATGFQHNVDAVAESAGAPEQFTFIRGDLRDAEAVTAACHGVDHVLHQAAMPSVPRSIEDPRTSHEVNVDGFVNVLEAARADVVKSMVYASSSSVYGDHPNLPKVESETGNVLSPYAATKQCNETLAQAWVQAYDMEIRGLRYFNVFGARQDPEGAYAAVIPRWIAAFVAGERPTIFGDGETSRDFCPIANVVQANILAAVAPDGAERTAYNVALGGRTTLNELFEGLRSALAALGAPCADAEPDRADFRPGDIRHSHADISLIQEQLGYQPQMGFAEGLDQTALWFWERR